MVVTSVVVWVFMIAFGVYRLRRYRAGTLEREALAYMRIAHAHRTGDLGVLEDEHRRRVTSDEQSPSVGRAARRRRLSRLTEL